jgi:hypothetical protein
MRSLTPKTIAIASLLAVIPLAGAYADQDPGAPTMNLFQGPRLSALVGQVDSVRQGIALARQGGHIDAVQARMLDARADRVQNAAERVAAADHGRIPSAHYRQLLRRLDNVSLRLQSHAGYPDQDDNSGSVFNG